MGDYCRRLFKAWRENDKSEEKVQTGDLDQDRFSWKTLFKFAGPGMLVSIAYLDPGNLLSDIQSGAAFNYRLIWVLVTATFLGLLMQVLAARLGTVTGQHLALLCRAEYGNRTFTTICLWIVTEIAIIASDIPEVVGSAFGLLLLFDIPLWAGVLMVSANTFILLGIQYFGVRKLEALITILVGVIGVCFLVEAFITPVKWGVPSCPTDDEWEELVTNNCTTSDIDYCPENFCGGVVGGFVPRMSPDTKMLLLATSLIGAVVMPHNLYLHSALVLTRHIDRTNPIHVKWADIYNTIECAFSLTISCIINVAIIVVAASVFFPSESNGYNVVQHLDEIGFLDASDLLATIGGSAKILFGIALLASGQSSTITGTYAGQFVMEGFLDIKIELWLRNLFTRAVAIVPSLVICLIAGTDGANTLIIVSSVILSFQLPFALIPLLKFTSSSTTMGIHKNSKMMVITCTALTVVVLTANGFLVAMTIFESLVGWVRIVVGAVGFMVSILYFSALGYLAWRPVHAALTSTGSYDTLIDDEIPLDDHYPFDDDEEDDDEGSPLDLMSD
ncbi:hypothetical protein, variant [Sphaeroforma arctica JP610]|uniref:Uncharacterized protein n=1 Tax=Sphaeroforma arctica JP610 TaxID=667725 RepID=A0A0L0G6U4_9EUKA|nr:hypothetical protein, variant [Sphaeroforma arctica JP610]KNC84576.1 hypothetical protein, variant [Sphaeroforma arctica JP610]|eukprot:XP_014158478.1 hypothetical protein, variant [Sphaeroforma arctica JP610]